VDCVWRVAGFGWPCGGDRLDVFRMKTKSPHLKPSSVLRQFLESEAAGGFILMGCAILALLVANSPLALTYFGGLATKFGSLSVLHWINDGLMVLFFLLVGLEIKRELLIGQLRSWSDRVLPGVAAAGGMIVPALIYVFINRGDTAALRGWAIPAATDIAFALGVLALFGSRIPVSLKIFLTALAIIDDLGAILIIAVFYTSDLSLPMLGLAVALLAVLIVMNRLGVSSVLPYLALGLLLWFFVLQSGIHATVAGVLLALVIPLHDKGSDNQGDMQEESSPLHRLEHWLAPWTAYLVLPVFGFANAGVSLSGLGTFVSDPVTLGVALGLFLGKLLGVFGSAGIALKSGFAKRPEGANLGQLFGVSILCGIGFTMSLFIGELAFAGMAQQETATKIGVLAGSFLAAVFGALVLTMSLSGQSDKPLSQ
jgi:Na+:H+ antiporter, NhaA family